MGVDGAEAGVSDFRSSGERFSPTFRPFPFPLHLSSLISHHFPPFRIPHSAFLIFMLLSLAQARRFHLRALRFDRPFDSIAEALGYMGYVQIDPINVCGRMHDLILRNRVVDYRADQLLEEIHRAPRSGFEHYLSVHVALPLEAWPFLVQGMKDREASTRGYARKLSAKEEKVARFVLGELRERGPLGADEIEHEGRAMTAWGTEGKLAKVVLEKLFEHGRVLIGSRPNYRRVYDLPERVLPPEVLATPLASAAETDRWMVLTKLRQRRLATLSRKELSLVADAVTALKLEDGGPTVYCLNEDQPLLEACASTADAAPVVESPRLLAPLDPLVYDRKLTARLWDFDYTWEVYTPPAKRKRGYYALPVLACDTLVGHVDLKADRKVGKLQTVGRKIARGHSAAPAVRDLARFLGLK